MPDDGGTDRPGPVGEGSPGAVSPAPAPAPDALERREPPSFPGDFLPEPTRDLGAWSWLWENDRTFPIESHRGVLGRVLVSIRRLLRPVVRAALADLFDRQRAFNLVLLENVGDSRRHVEDIRVSHQNAIEAHARRMEEFDVRLAGGMTDVMRHNDALFALVDQKLDRARRETRELWGRLDALIAAAPPEVGGPTSAAAHRVRREQTYLELEERWRGSEQDIADRFAEYLPLLRERGPVLDLGCGRGEALTVLRDEGIPALGVDSSSEMVERCRALGLDVVEGDLLEHLTGVEPGSLGAVVSFHVIEHLPDDTLDRLVRLSWRALRPGGALILETPSPLSLRQSARDFWIDPTHLRPVHPASLEVLYRDAGFAPVHRLDLHPFGEDERLPEIDRSSVPEDQRPLADEMNRLRDVLDDLLFGSRDYALVGIRG